MMYWNTVKREATSEFHRSRLHSRAEPMHCLPAEGAGMTGWGFGGGYSSFLRGKSGCKLQEGKVRVVWRLTWGSKEENTKSSAFYQFELSKVPCFSTLVLRHRRVDVKTEGAGFSRPAYRS